MAVPRRTSKAKSECTTERWAEHLEAKRTDARRQRLDNPSRALECASRYRANHPDRVSESQSKYMDSDKGRATRRSCQRRWRDANAESCRLRVRLSQAMAGYQCPKVKSAVADLGIHLDAFRVHIESQFEPGMAWENRGNRRDRWSLDHVFPLNQADLSSPVEAAAVLNWRNYQPLWHVDNASKGDTVSDAARERFEVLANFLEVL